MVDFEKINFISQKIIDKPVYSRSGSFTVGAPNVASWLYRLTIPHSIGRPMFMDGVFTHGGNPTMNGYNVITYSDASNVYILTYVTAGTVIDYNIAGQWIDDYDNTDPDITPEFLATTDEKFTFNSNNRYRAVAVHGSALITSSGALPPIPHGLGKIPEYQIFFESLPNEVWPQISGGASNIWLYDANQNEVSAYVDSTNLVIQAPTFQQNMNVWYRVYH